MSFYLKLILGIFVLGIIFHFIPSVSAADFGPGPAGIPQLQYLVARLVCIAVPMGFTAMFVVLVITGIKFITSGGEAKAIQSANLAVTWAFLGVLFMAIALLILLLIQNATGAKVTEFNLATLPGVQGFTGSCWAPPSSQTTSIVQPSPSTNTFPSMNNLSSSNVTPKGNGFPNEGFDTHVLNCEPSLDSYPQLRDVISAETGEDPQHIHYYVLICYPPRGFICNNSSELFIPVPPNQYNLLSYRTADGIRDLINVFLYPVPIFTSAGAADSNLYVPTQTLVSLLSNWFPSISSSGPSAEGIGSWDPNRWSIQNMIGAGGVFARYPPQPRAFVPVELLSAQVAAREVANRLSPTWGSNDITDTATTRLDFSTIRCPDGDYFVTGVISPLIYLYPKSTTSVSVTINSRLLSPTLKLNNGTWNILAFPDGNLTTLDGKKYKNIPYEFLRNDFKRPDKGTVVRGSKLEEYLKTNLWPKLGLTDSEINDYWNDTKPRVKSSPYYFISLIDRSEVDRVLPMEVNPKPDTIIRNMTYILPLPSEPTQSIKPVEISKLERNGFTVLENGVFVDGF